MTALGGISSSATIQSGDVGDFNTAAYTRTKAILVAGTNVTLTPNDGAGTITVNSAGGGGGAFVDAVTDTNTVDLTVASGALSAVIPTTATPTIRSLTLSAAAMTNQVLIDHAHGDDISVGSSGAPALRYSVRHGTSGSPVGNVGPSVKVTRSEQFTSTTQGDQFFDHSAILGMATAVGNSTTMPVGVTGSAQNSSTGTFNTTTLNTDACGIVGDGRITGSGTGAALGAFFQALQFSTACRAVHAVEALVNNQSGVAGTDTTHSAYFATLSGQAGGSMFRVLNASALKWSTGILFASANGGPVSGASIQDDGTSVHSILVNGTHTSAAIAIASTAGKFLAGLTSTAVATKAMIQSSADTDSALTLQANSVTQSVNIFQVRDGTPAIVFSVGSTGHVTMGEGCNLFTGTTTGTKIGNSFTQKVGFWGGTPRAQATVTGSRAGNAALASLLTAMAACGMVVDSSSA